MDSETVLKVIRTLVGDIEPYGDSGIDRERTENLETLLYIMDDLLYDVQKVADYKDRHEGSMRTMGEKAYTMLKFWRDELNKFTEE